MLNIKTLTLGAYRTNCYVVWADDAETCVVIDPGYEPDVIYANVKDLGKKIEAILLTHGHFDHVGGACELALKAQCPVYLCGEEGPVSEAVASQPPLYTNTYQEADTLTMAGTVFEVLQTPGHTSGSICLLAEDAMFSGDTLFAECCGRTDLPTGSWQEMEKSLRRLASLQKNYKVYPGHGRSTTLSYEKYCNPYMKGTL